MAQVRNLDNLLFSLLTPLIFEEYEYLRPVRLVDESRKEHFLNGTSDDPDLSYERILDLDFSALRKTVDALRNELSSGGYHPAVIEAYEEAVGEAEQKIGLLEAALAGDDEQFMVATEALYGTPDPALFVYSLSGVGHLFDEARAKTDDSRLVRELEALSPLVSFTSATEIESIHPPRVEVASDTQGEALSAADIRDLCLRALEKYDIDTWRVEIDPPKCRVSFNVNQMTKTVHIPHDRDMVNRKSSMTPLRVEALIAHEVGTHVVRRERGEQSGFGLLSLGMAGYLRGEEGIATYREQCLIGTSDYSGEIGYISVGLALGLDGTPRTFRELFDLLKSYFVARTICGDSFDPSDVDVLLERAISYAWSRSLRTCRGTTGMTPGIAFTRDIVYREGNIRIWDLVRIDPSWTQYFSLGKFDPTNAQHVRMLSELEILKLPESASLIEKYFPMRD